MLSYAILFPSVWFVCLHFIPSELRWCFVDVFQQFGKAANSLMLPSEVKMTSPSSSLPCNPFVAASVAGAAAGCAAFLTAPLDKVKLRWVFEESDGRP